MSRLGGRQVAVAGCVMGESHRGEVCAWAGIIGLDFLKKQSAAAGPGVAWRGKHVLSPVDSS